MAGRKKRPKHYEGTWDFYRGKLRRSLDRMHAKDVSMGDDDNGVWVEFRYKDEPHRFEHTLRKAAALGVPLAGPRDCLAQLAYGLEDLARLSERGIYDLGSWIVGMKALPGWISSLPRWAGILEFDRMPAGIDDVVERYRRLSRSAHPDLPGGRDERMRDLNAAMAEARTYFGVGEITV